MEPRLPERTAVGIVGGGPAGLLLARLLDRSGIPSVVLESRDRTYAERRQRAGVLEQSTVEVLRRCGAGARMDREGLPHDGIELRFGGRSHRVDFPSLTGGRRVLIYAQTEIVKDLIALHLGAPAGAARLLFEARVTAVEGIAPRPEAANGAEEAAPDDGADTGGPVIRFLRGGREHTLRCTYVVGCDGSHGVARAAAPPHATRTYGRDHPYSWLGVLADVPPSCEELVYAHSPRGFALHSMRSPAVSRLYLQVPNGTDPDDWPDERVWDELDARFALDDAQGWRLRRGPLTSKAVLPMRSAVTEPMRYGRLFLAGDAAHVVPPTGAKGLNLAVADVAVLADAFARHFGAGDDTALDAYSDTCLRRVWQAEYFSSFMTTTLHSAPDQSAFDTRLQLAQLDRIARSTAAATELAENYAGLPIATTAAHPATA